MSDAVSPLRSVAALMLAASALAALPAVAQGVYRMVGPDGRVTYSDTPPANDQPTQPVSGGGSTSTGGASAATLPYALRQATSRYPVTLYTGADCNPCKSGMAYLDKRGIPFAEKTVTSNADIQALQRLSGSNSLPVLTIGSQQMRGFSEAEWKQYLDAAGYPAQSALPAGYRRPAASPVVDQAQAPAAGTPGARPPLATTSRDSSAPAPVPVTPPTGIRF